VRRLPPFAALAAMLLAAPAAGADAPRLFVLAFKAPPALTFTGKRLAQAVATQAVKTGSFEVLGPDEVEERLGHRAYLRLVECAGDARCIADADVPLSADRIVGGQLKQLENTYQVTVSQVDLKTGQPIASYARIVAIGSRQLVAEIAQVSGPLLRGEPEGKGSLFVSASVPRAEVRVDGNSTGYTPLSVRVTPGRHSVEVEKPGYVKAAPQTVEVADGSLAEVAVTLTPLPPTAEPDRR